MDVQIVLLEELRAVREHRLHDTDRNLRRFLHDIAELACQNQLACARRQQSLDIENLASDLRPGKSRDNARLRVAKHRVVMDRSHVQLVPQHIRCDHIRTACLSASVIRLYSPTVRATLRVMALLRDRLILSSQIRIRARTLLRDSFVSSKFFIF